MKKLNLENSILLLTQLRMEMHDKMDNSQLQILDSVIVELKNADSQNQKLELLGKVFNSIPWICKIIEHLSQL